MTGESTRSGLAMLTTTVSAEADARQLAQAALTLRLAACVQVEPITSHYHWEGALQEERELRLVFKTLRQTVPALLAMLQERHPYTLPQLVVQPLDASAEYFQWVAEQLARPAPSPA